MTDQVQARELAAMEQRALAAEAEAKFWKERNRYARATILVTKNRMLRAETKRLSEALAEVQRRAGLQIRPSVTGVPADALETAASIAECIRLVLAHVVEPARAALKGDQP